MDCSVLTDNAYRGISNSGDWCTIVGNVVHDTRSNSRMDFCIYVPGNNNVIVGNNTSGASGGDNIYASGTGNVEANNKD